MDNTGYVYYDNESNVSKVTISNGKEHESKTIEHGAEGTAEKQSEGFGSKLEFLLAMVSYAVGLGNVWRFPYLAQKWGGGKILYLKFYSLLK